MMALLNRGRLSVQPAEEEAFSVIQSLAETGGWEDSENASRRKRNGAEDGTIAKQTENVEKRDTTTTGRRACADGASGDLGMRDAASRGSAGRKRKVIDEGTFEPVPIRRSTRSRKRT